MRSDNNDRTIKAELLIIGGGFGGLWAAIKAKQNGVSDVSIVDKGAVALTGQSKLCAGATVYLHPGDDADAWAKAIFLGQQGLTNQDMVKSFLEQSTERLREIEGFGINYRKNPFTGEYVRMPSRGLFPAQMTIFPEFKGLIGGSALTTVLRKEALRVGVKFYNKIFINDIITKDNRAMGAVGVHRRTGEFILFLSKAVIIAACDCSFKGNYCCVESTTGDAFSMAFRAGADINNMEFLCVNTAPIKYNFEGTGPAGQFGAKFLNAVDEDFMHNYRPEGSGAEIAHIVQAMVQEAKKGNGPPFYFDFRPLPANAEDIYMSMGGWMPKNLTSLKESGVNIFDAKVDWMPAIQTLRGGIMTDINCMSRVDGLFASGTAHSMGPGLFNGWSTAKSFWSGVTAGVAAARFIRDSGFDEVKKDTVDQLKVGLFSRKIEPESGEMDLSEIDKKIQTSIFSHDVSILKSENSIERAKKELVAIKENDQPKAKIENLHDFIKYKEMENMIFAAELFYTASLLRKETRADHFREDYPKRDQKWLKWIVLNINEKKGYRFEELPWKKYSYQPEDLED